jgi:hypothetical protein
LLIVAVVVAAWGWLQAYRWLKRMLRVAVELEALVISCEACGLKPEQIAAAATRELPGSGRAPFEVLRILRRGA